MTSHQLLEQLIDDRRADLAGSRTRRVRAPRWHGGWKVRRGAGQTSGPAEPVRHMRAVVPSVAGAASAERSTGDWATSLAHLVADHGLRANEAAIARMVRTARHHHVLRLCADILEDRSLPDVVRERALGRVLTGLTNSTEVVSAPSDRAA